MCFSAVLISCKDQASTHSVAYLDDPLENKFDTIIQAHHDSLSSRITAFSDNLYGYDFRDSDANMQITIKGEGIDASFDVKSKSKIDEQWSKNDSDHSYDLKIAGDTPMFPTKISITATWIMELFQEGIDLYLNLSNTSIVMKDQEDISSQLLSMIKLFEGQWIYLTQDDASVFDPQWVTKNRDIKWLLTELSGILSNQSLITYIQDAESEDRDYYVYKVALNPEALKKIVASVSWSDIPLDSDVIQFIESEQVSSWFRMHKQSPELWSLDIIDAGGGSMTIEENKEGYGIEYNDLSMDNRMNLFVTRWTKNTWEIKIVKNGKNIFDGDFTYSLSPSSHSLEAQLYFRDVAYHKKPIEVSLTRIVDNREHASLELSPPSDFVSAKDLGLGQATNSSEINLEIDDISTDQNDIESPTDEA